MFTNKLKLNPDKIEFILIGSKNNCKQLLPHVPVDNQVSPAQSVKNLRVVFDSKFTLSDNVSQVIKSTRILPLLNLKTSVLSGYDIVPGKQ